MKLTSSINALKRRKQARDAVPTEYPLVLALVTLPGFRMIILSKELQYQKNLKPTASSLSVILLTFSV